MCPGRHGDGGRGGRGRGRGGGGGAAAPSPGAAGCLAEEVRGRRRYEIFKEAKAVIQIIIKD